MTESPLLRDVLKDEWGWDGLVMSDWGAGRHTERAGNAALDLVMPGPDGPWGDALVDAVRDGRVSEAAVDEKVLRLLRLAERVGALGGGRAAARRGATTAIAAELRATAAASFVLARNHGDAAAARGRCARVAVLGPNAAVARTLGGGSATVFPSYTVSPLDGLRAALDAEVTYAPGVRAYTRLPVADVVAELRYLAADGAELSRERRETGEFAWMGTLGDDVAAIELTATVRAEQAGEYVIGCSGVGRHQLSLDGEEAFDAVLELRPAPTSARRCSRRRSTACRSRWPPARRSRSCCAASSPTRDLDLVTLQLNVDPPFGDGRARAGRRAGARGGRRGGRRRARRAEVESEGFDRSSLALPGPPGRARPARRGRQPAHGRGRQRGRAGADAVAGRGAGGAAGLVPGAGGGQRDRRRAARAQPSPAAGCRRPGRRRRRATRR